MSFFKDFFPPCLTEPTSPAPNKPETSNDKDLPDNQPQSTSSTASFTSQNSRNNLKIPWGSFPQKLVNACEQGKQPESSDRREMIRIIMSNIMSTPDTQVGRNELRMIAGKIVAKYPESFADRINGETIGDGTMTLLQQLENRRENESRKNPGKNLKRKAKAASNDDEEAPVPVKELDSYGCIKGRWEGKMEGADTEEVQEETRQALMKEYEESPDNWNKKNIGKWMEATFPLQRKDINSSKLTVAAVLDRWPFLVEQRWFSQHFKLLTGKDVEANKWATKAERMYAYLKSKAPQHLKDTMKAIKDEMELTQNKMPIIDNLSTMLAAYFGEREATLICKYQDVSTCILIKTHI